jgi:hypothetical protein
MSPASSQPIYLGFRAKKRHQREGAWEAKHLPANVLEICSVADCITKPPPGWLERWDFNRAFCYPSAAAAWATVPAAAKEEYEVFVYWLLPFTVGGGQRQPVKIDDLFDQRLPPLPQTGGATTGFEQLGFDVFERSAPAQMGFGHSPLSCNGMANEVKVNCFCLVETEGEAAQLIERCNQEQPEPGIFYGMRVERERR